MARIKIGDIGYWDTDKPANEQSKAARQWVDETRRTEADQVIRDSFGRPAKWIYRRDNVVLIIEHVFLYPNTPNWTVDKININVTKQ